MNILDILMLLALIIGVAVGFVRGMVQQAIGLLSIYISMIVGVWGHRLFGSGFKYLFPALTRPSADILGFATAMIVVLNALGFVTRDWHKESSWVEKVPALLNQTGGLVLGFFTTAFWLGLAGLAMVIISDAPWVTTEGARDTFAALVDNSIMVYVFRYAFRLALYTIYPWIPGGLPDIFETPL